jgi:hypothetical protein
MENDMPAKIPVSAIVNIPHIQLPTISTPALIYLIFKALKAGDRVDVDGESYIYEGEK